MSDNKKYYYLKLKEDFFDNEEMKVLESMKNGVEYQNVYLKMCLLSLKSDGALLFKNMLPYSLEMLSSVLRVNIDTIKTAVEIFQKIGLVTVTDTETIYMTDIQSLVGQSSTEAERVRKYRQNLAQKKQEQIECTNDVQMYENCTENVQKCTPEIRDKSIEIRDKSIDSPQTKFECDDFPEDPNEIKSKKTTRSKKSASFSEADYKSCMDIYYNNRDVLSKTQEVTPTIYDPKTYRSRIKCLFEKYGVEKTKQGVKNSINYAWVRTTDYNIRVAFSYNLFDEYIANSKGTQSLKTKYQKPRGCESINGAPREQYLGEIF